MTDPAAEIPNRLRALFADSGVGFCYDIDRQLFGLEGTHGPLLVGWDTNVLIDFQTHGAQVFNNEPLLVGDVAYEAELYALGALINLWLIRDIRFLILPRGERDHRGPETDKTRRKDESIAALADALTFQLQDWGHQDARYSDDATASHNAAALHDFPAGADRELIVEAERY